MQINKFNIVSMSSYLIGGSEYLVVNGNFYKKHHRAWHPGYISRKKDMEECYMDAEFYNGRFGYGLIVHYPDFRSTRFHHVEYFIRCDIPDLKNVSTALLSRIV